MGLSRVLRGDLLQSNLVINVNGLVEFEKNLCYILPTLSFRETNISIFTLS